MGAIWIAWVGMGGHRSLLMIMIWVWVQIWRKMLGSGVKSTWIPTWHQNHLLEVGLIQKTRRPWHSETSQPLIHYILSCVRTPHEHKFTKIAFGFGPGHIWLHTTLEGPWPHYMIFGSVSGRPLDTFIWALTISFMVLARVWSGPQLVV